MTEMQLETFEEIKRQSASFMRIFLSEAQMGVIRSLGFYPDEHDGIYVSDAREKVIPAFEALMVDEVTKKLK
jgi:hypothetical protein